MKPAHHLHLSRRAVLTAGGICFLTACASGPNGSAAPTSAPTIGATAPAAGDAGFADIVAKAKTEGRVSLYTVATPGLADKISAGFTKRYGIALDAVQLTGGPLAARFAAEQQAGTASADVIQSSDTVFLASAVKQGWIAKVGDLPSLRTWPAKYWKDNLARSLSNPNSMAYNARLVAAGDAPKGWQDLLDPRWKGKIIFGDPRSTAVTFATWALLRKTYGDAYLTGLAGQSLKLSASGATALQSLAAGEGAIAMLSTHQASLGAIKTGAPIADVIPSPTVLNEDWIGVVQNRPHSNAALVLLDWILSAEGQSAICGNQECISDVDAPDTLKIQPDWQSPDLAEGQAQQADILRLLGIK